MVATWLVLGIAAVIIFLVIFKSQDVVFIFALIKKNIFMIFLVVLFLFLAFSITSLNKSHDLDYTTFDGVVYAGKVYMGWLGDVGRDLGSLTGYAIRQDWGLDQNVSRVG